jgi:hypothetical protein
MKFFKRIVLSIFLFSLCVAAFSGCNAGTGGSEPGKTVSKPILSELPEEKQTEFLNEKGIKTDDGPYVIEPLAYIAMTEKDPAYVPRPRSIFSDKDFALAIMISDAVNEYYGITPDYGKRAEYRESEIRFLISAGFLDESYAE